MFKPYSKRSAVAYITALRISDLLDRWPGLYLSVLKLRLTKTGHWIAGEDHLLAIEAFPRSGSSFTHRAFQKANPEARGRIASHIHRSSQVIRAAGLGLPTLVLVRDPRNAVTSLLALAVQQGHLAELSPDEARRCMAATLHRYAVFHERILDLPGVQIAGFEEVISDVGKLTARMNARFGTDFVEFNHTDEAVAELMSKARRHLGPNVDRDKIKATFATAYDSANLDQLRHRAETVYARMMTWRDAQILEDSND